MSSKNNKLNSYSQLKKQLDKQEELITRIKKRELSRTLITSASANQLLSRSPEDVRPEAVSGAEWRGEATNKGGFESNQKPLVQQLAQPSSQSYLRMGPQMFSVNGTEKLSAVKPLSPNFSNNTVQISQYLQNEVSQFPKQGAKYANQVDCTEFKENVFFFEESDETSARKQPQNPLAKPN